MTKNIEEIEQLLREKKLPDQDAGYIRNQLWQKILEENRKRKKTSPLFRIRPWIWTLASLIVLAVSLFIMWLIHGSFQ
ncbi:hypothetical protein JW948_19145 [bacterium]|nr:hypothetical protein [bacterium]